GMSSRTSLVIIGYAIPIAGMVVCTGLRLIAKWTTSSTERFLIDDYLILLGTALEISDCAVMLAYGVKYGFGKHVTDLTAYDLMMFLKGDYIVSHLYNVGLATVKLGILALYYRIFAVASFRRAVLACALVIGLWIFTIEIFMGLLCRPLAHYWDSAHVKGKCFDATAMTYYVNTSNMITDIVIFALPIPVILRLRTSKHNRVALIAIFSIGFMTCGISAARLAYVFAQSSPDITWDGVPLGVLSAFESLGGIICANLPVVYRLFKQAAQKITSHTRSSTARRTAYGSRTMSKRLHRGSAAGLTTDPWVRLNNASSNGSEGFEMDKVPVNAISVQQEVFILEGSGNLETERF
ncbi:hypothetical protein ASPZODRAFT_76364, partial [Penicilliopsis zonata CBS 506.65]